MEDTNMKFTLKSACVFLPHDIRSKIAKGKALTKEEHDEYIVCGRWMGDQEVIDHWRSNPETMCGQPEDIVVTKT